MEIFSLMDGVPIVSVDGRNCLFKFCFKSIVFLSYAFPTFRRQILIDEDHPW